MNHMFFHSSGSLRRKAIAACLSVVLLGGAALPALHPSSRVTGSLTVSAAGNADSASAVAVDPTGKGEGYSTVLYDNSNGLPTAEANAIVQTPDGFIWIGSYSGLTRYDGKDFDRIDSTQGIASVVSLFVDSKERLWIGTNDSGVAVMEKDSYRFVQKTDGLHSSSIRAITEDAAGNIYIATTQGVAMITPDLKLNVINAPEINEEYIRQLYRGADDVIYGVTNNGAVFTLENGSLVGFYDAETLGIPNIRAVLPDMSRPGYLYIGTMASELYHGSLQSRMANAELIDISPLNFVNSMAEYNGRLWVCADKGICLVNGSNVIPLQNIPVDSSLECCIADYQGNLWFASSKQGVLKITPNQFSDIFQRYELPSSVINTTCMYRGMLYIGGQNNGLTVIGADGAQESLPPVPMVSASGEALGTVDLIALLEGCRIRSIVTDKRDNLWIATYSDHGLLRYDGETVTRFSAEEGMPSNRVRTVVELSDGSYLAACSGGATVIKDDAVAMIYGEEQGIENSEILTVAEGLHQDMLIGTDGGGIYVVSNGSVSRIGTENGLSSDVVMRIKKDIAKDVYWIVTSNSISYLDKDYSAYTVRKFPYSNNFDLYQNSKGEMWILSSNGVYVIDSEDMIANGELNPVYYGMDNGLCCIATANSYSALTPSGDLYIAGTTGVAKVNIETPFEDVSDIKMSVPYVEADGKRLYFDESGSVTIPSDTKKLTIYSYVYNYSLINPDVSYHLDGFDAHSTTVRRSELTPVNYTNLKGGSYHFVMQLLDMEGNTGEELSMTIVKKKSLYEMLWFRILSGVLGVLAVGGAVMLYIRRKTKAFRKKEQEQKQLIREIVEAFAKVIDMKDKYTNGHSSRVAQYTVMLARELGYSEEEIDKFYNIALLHDIGKVGVPPEVLNKAGKLTDEEFAIIKSHPALGYDTLKGISIMPELAIGAGFHHERPDGKGYPKGLQGAEIPRVAQIIAVADTFDAMYSNRPYRKRMNFDKAVSIIKSVRGTQLTEDVVDAFLRLVEKGEFRAPDDVGGGTTDDIDNIHKKFDAEKKEEAARAAAEEKAKGDGASASSRPYERKLAPHPADRQPANSTGMSFQRYK